MTDRDLRGVLARIGAAAISVDAPATRAAFAARKTGSPEECGCLHCRNFIAARQQVYPALVLELFERLGVDHRKEAEIYHNGPLDSGLHSYGGWFHAVGELVAGKSAEVPLAPNAWTLDLSPFSDTFRLGVTSDPQLVPEAFRGLALVQLEFEAHAPWVLPEPPE